MKSVGENMPTSKQKYVYTKIIVYKDIQKINVHLKQYYLTSTVDLCPPIHYYRDGETLCIERSH